MTYEEVNLALSHVVAATPGFDDRSVIEYADQLVTLDDGEALEAACAAIARAWVEPRRPPIAVIIEAYDRETAHAARALDPSRVHCDGSGWRQVDDDLVPCARCSPAVFAAYSDPNPDKWAEYRAGVGMEHLDIDVETQSGRLRHRGGVRPPVCRSADDYELVPDPETGRRVMFDAYTAVALAAGRKPDRRHAEAFAP